MRRAGIFIKYLVLMFVEMLLGVYLLLFQHVLFLHMIPLLFILVICPAIYFLFTMSDIFKSRSFLPYLLSLIPLAGLLAVAFFRDGLTTFQDNPDSSMFGWFFGFSFIRIALFVLFFSTAAIVFFIRKNIVSKKRTSI